MPEQLPEKCCARCGFLYGVARNAATIAGAVFDPDVIRSPTYPPQQGQERGYSSIVIASRPYICIEQKEKLENPMGKVSRGEEARYRHITEYYVGQHFWSNTHALHCYLNKIEPFKDIRWIQEPAKSSHWKKISDAIRSDRENCDGFFPYHPGFTAAQHVELKLEQQRALREDRQEERWKKTERRLTIFAITVAIWAGCCGAVEAIATLVSALVDAGIIHSLSPLP